MSNPRVSVVMPAYNRAKFIGSSIDSILMQTYRDFELIIVDDGSTDDTVEIIKKYDDPRIRLIQHEKNRGVAAARNTGYRNAKGEFIVIADSDDINLPTKFEEQVRYLDENEDVDIVGCNYKIFYDDKFVSKWIYYQSNEEIRCTMIFWPGLPAASMFRKERINKLNLLYHDETYLSSVDYEWFAKMPINVKFSNINKCLYLYRSHENQISSNRKFRQLYYANIIRKKLLMQLKIDVTERNIELHEMLCNLMVTDGSTFYEIKLWVEKIIKANEELGLYNRKLFKKIVSQKFYQLCNKYSHLGISVWKQWESFIYRNDSNELKLNFDMHKLGKLLNKKVAIFGTKRSASILKDELFRKDIQIIFFIDNNIDDSHEKCDGIPIYTEDHLDKYQEVDSLIITVLSDYKFLLKEKLNWKYPFINVILIDELII